MAWFCIYFCWNAEKASRTICPNVTTMRKNGMFDSVFAREIQDTLEHFRRTMDEVWGEFFGASGGSGAAPALAGTDGRFVPAVETGWNDESLNLRVVLPGVREGDVKVQMQGRKLVIEGERKEPENFAANGGSLRLVYGKFHRVVDLPEGVDAERVQCRLHDGVLDIRVPIAEAMRPRQIPIEGVESRKAIAA
jgi:HSP20 family protein